MPIVISCPSCKAKLKAPDNAVGKKVKCPGCSEAITVQAPASAAAPAPAKAAPPRRAEDDFEVVDDHEDERPRKPAKVREDDLDDVEEDRPRKPLAYLGVGFDPDTDDLEILEVYEKSPAAKARLNVGDVILRLDGKKASKRSDLSAFLHKRKPGDEITIEVQGEDDSVEVEVKLGKRPAD